jgi:hypothetical protein
MPVSKNKPQGSGWCVATAPDSWAELASKTTLDEILKALPELTVAELEKLHRALVRKRAAPFSRRVRR